MNDRDVPWLAELLIRCALQGDDVARALSDLADVCERTARRRRPAIAALACIREAIAIAAWSLVDRVRRAADGARDRGTRLERRRSMVRDIVHDVRYSIRALSRRPGFSLLAAALLALGIGAVTSIFTLSNALFLAPPPGVRAPEQLIRVFRSGPTFVSSSLGYADFLEYRQARTLAGLAAYDPSPIPATGGLGESLVPVGVAPVSDGFFEVLGLEPALGRFISPEENRTPGTHPVAVASWDFWQRQLGGAADVVGRDILLNGRRFTIIGVTPRAYRGLTPAAPMPDVHIPILMRDAVAPSFDSAWRERLPDSFERWLTVVGRLRPDATVEAARGELEAISARIRAAYPTEPQDESVYVTDEFRWSPSTLQSLSALMRLLLAVVLVVLAVAAANVAILLLVRATLREREIGILSAIGAGRGRVTRQLFVESVLLSLLGGAGGIVLSLWATRVAAALLPVRLDPAPTPDARVLLVALAISIATAIVVGSAPAIRAARGDVFGMIHGRSRGRSGGRARDVLVVVQVALSLVLVAGAALFARSLAAARALDLGFDSRNVLAVEIDLRNHGYDVTRGRAFLTEATDRIGAIPGVVGVATTRQIPFRGEWTNSLKPWPGASFAAPEDGLRVGVNTVGEGYFDVVGVPILAGRPILASDHAEAEPVVVVNEQFARTVFGDEDVVGRIVPLQGDRSFRIVGVARNATYYDLGEQPRLQVYGSSLQIYQPRVTFFVKTAGSPLTVARPVQETLLAMDRNLAFRSVEPLERIEAEQVAPYRATAHVVGLSGIIALLLACAGLYGVMAYRVAEQTREIGVRMALGATRHGVARAVLLTGMRLAALGAALGFLGALALSRLVRGLLFGIEPNDPLSLTAAPLLMLAVALAALVVPARRAMMTDPMRAMRAE